VAGIIKQEPIVSWSKLSAMCISISTDVKYSMKKS